MRSTKLVCTLGPSTVGIESDLVSAGMDVARINFSHGSEAEHRRAVAAVRNAAHEFERPVGVLADLPGPKVRLGEIAGGQAELHEGAIFVLDGRGRPGDATGVTTNHPGLARDLRPGDVAYLSDGAVELKVIEARGDALITEVVRGDIVRSRGGINVPAGRLSLPALTAQDHVAVSSALELNVDFVAQSFVRRSEDVLELRDLLGAGRTRVMAKIETAAAVNDIDRIIVEADAIMVARGDLGVEIPFETVPVVQRDLVMRARATHTPVVIATQMLESMVTAARPTRAEVSDVANAVFDGVDAILLSAETAIGAYPLATVNAAHRTVEASERAILGRIATAAPHDGRSIPVDALSAAAIALAEHQDVSAIACFTNTGYTASRIAALGPSVPVFACCDDAAVARRLTMQGGVIPTTCDPLADDAAVGPIIERALLRARLAAAGDVVVVVGRVDDAADVEGSVALRRLTATST